MSRWHWLISIDKVAHKRPLFKTNLDIHNHAWHEILIHPRNLLGYQRNLGNRTSCRFTASAGPKVLLEHKDNGSTPKGNGASNSCVNKLYELQQRTPASCTSKGSPLCISCHSIWEETTKGCERGRRHVNSAFSANQQTNLFIRGVLVGPAHDSCSFCCLPGLRSGSMHLTHALQ